MRLDALLRDAAGRLAQAGSPTARLDAEVLLCHVLGVERTWLYTWGDRIAAASDQARYEALIAARAEGRPVAYLVEAREFWGLSLATSPHTLIPRPDTETLVEVALSLAAGRGRLLDLGTGTGAIALAFASERGDWSVLGVDRVPEAAALAAENAKRLGISNARFLASDWFSALAGERFDLIVANPPILPRMTRTCCKATCASSHAAPWSPEPTGWMTCATWSMPAVAIWPDAAGWPWSMATTRRRQ